MVDTARNRKSLANLRNASPSEEPPPVTGGNPVDDRQDQEIGRSELTIVRGRSADLGPETQIRLEKRRKRLEEAGVGLFGALYETRNIVPSSGHDMVPGARVMVAAEVGVGLPDEGGVVSVDAGASDQRLGSVGYGKFPDRLEETGDDAPCAVGRRNAASAQLQKIQSRTPDVFQLELRLGVEAEGGSPGRRQEPVSAYDRARLIVDHKEVIAVGVVDIPVESGP
jgi:hypothetical protein